MKTNRDHSNNDNDSESIATQSRTEKNSFKVWSMRLIWVSLSLLALYESWEYTNRVPQTAHMRAEMEQPAVKARDQIAFFAGGGLSQEGDQKIIGELTHALRTGEFTTSLIGIPDYGQENSPAHNWLARMRVLAGVRELVSLDKKIVELYDMLAKEKRFANAKERQDAETWLNIMHASLDEFWALKGDFSFDLHPTVFDSRSIHVGLRGNDLITAENAEEYFRAIITGRIPYAKWSPGP